MLPKKHHIRIRGHSNLQLFFSKQLFEYVTILTMQKYLKKHLLKLCFSAIAELRAEKQKTESDDKLKYLTFWYMFRSSTFVVLPVQTEKALYSVGAYAGTLHSMGELVITSLVQILTILE